MNSFHVIADKEPLLDKLRGNRAKHAQIVKEAREGYISQAATQLEARLNDLRAGKLTDLTFYLRPPEDHTVDYDTAISMLEMHQEDAVELGAEDCAHFVEDRWDWAKQFFALNKRYSKSATVIAEANGY